MDVLTPEQRKRNMRAIKSKNTKMEQRMANALWNMGYRFRRNSKNVIGKPDFSLKKYKLAIFLDGEFFHGKDWETEKYRIKTNRDFWWNKIEANMKRDILVNLELRKEGWTVLRFWGKEVKKNIDFCLLTIKKELEIRKDAEILRSKGKVKN